MQSLQYPTDFKGWTTIRRERAVIRDYVILLSPDKIRSATICLNDNSVISIYNREEGRMEYSLQGLEQGVELIVKLMDPSVLPSRGPDFFKTLRHSVINGLIARGIKCAHCKIPYINYPDFMERNPRKGLDGDLFVDAFCWDAYQTSKKLGTE